MTLELWQNGAKLSEVTLNYFQIGKIIFIIADIFYSSLFLSFLRMRSTFARSLMYPNRE
jgi:hypothetical protein